MEKSFNAAKELHHVQRVNCMKAAISRTIKSGTRSLFSETAREMRQAGQGTMDSGTSKVASTTLRTVAPLVTGGVDTIRTVNALKTYLTVNKELRDSIEKYSESGKLKELGDAMEKTGVIKKGQSIEVTNFRLSNIINRGTIVRDQLSGDLTALHDFTSLDIEEVEIPETGRKQFNILQDGIRKASVDEKTVRSWAKEGRISADGKKLIPKEGYVDLTNFNAQFRNKRVRCRVKGGDLCMMNVDSGQNMEKYKTFLKLSRKYNIANPSAPIPKEMQEMARDLRKKHIRAARAKSLISPGRIVRIPKRILKSWGRNVAMPLRQSEAMQGYSIAEAISFPARMVITKGASTLRRHVANPVINSAYNIALGQTRLRRALKIQSGQNISFRGAWEQAGHMSPLKMVKLRNLGQRNPFMASMRVSLGQDLRMGIAQKLGGSKNAILRSIADRAYIQEAGRRAGLSKDAVQALIEANRRALLSGGQVSARGQKGIAKGKDVKDAGSLKSGNPLSRAFKGLIQREVKRIGRHNAGETLPSYLKRMENGVPGTRPGALFDDAAKASGSNAKKALDAVQGAADATRKALMGASKAEKNAAEGAAAAGKVVASAKKKVEKEAGKAINRAAGKAAKGAADAATVAGKGAASAAKATGTAVKGAVEGAKGAAGAVQAAIEAVKSAAIAAAQFIEAAAAFIVEFWWAILIAIAAIVLIVALTMVFMAMFKQEEDITTETTRFESTNRLKWEDYSTEIMDQLTAQHAEEQVLIDDLLDDYPVADVQYPSGERENYKELFAAMEVQIQYNPDCISFSELSEVARKLYKRTHVITLCPYTFYDEDGTEHEACHIYVNIQRGDALCYEDLYVETDEDGICTTGARMGIAGGGNVGYLYTPSVTVQNNDWIDVVETVKQAISATGCYYYDLGDNRTDNDAYVNVNVNGETISIRPDCSGFISACLYLYGAADDPDAFTSASLATASSLPGFYVQKFKGWDSLMPGDIIAKKGHCEIFAGSSAGNNYVWNCGSDYSVSQPGETTSASSVFMTVLRPYSTAAAAPAPGTPVTPAPASAATGLAATYTGTDVTGFESDTVYPYTSGFSEEDYRFPLSNTADVVMDPNTLCEVGYDASLRATLAAEMASTEYFTEAAFEDGLGDHTLAAPGVPATASDFVRYIFSRHGVQFEMNDSKAIYDRVAISKERTQAGCVIFYMPSCAEANELKSALKYGDFAVIGGELEREVRTPGGAMINVGEVVRKYAIPLICTGNGTAVAYSRDLLSYDYLATPAAIREYNIDDLDDTRILNTELFIGFTVDPVFGNTPYFEGWINENVACLIEIITDDCWETGEKRFAEDDPGVSDFSIDYSWYDPGNDQFEGNVYYASDEHKGTFKDEMLSLFVKHYDEYGILPSYGYAYTSAVSRDRSTEESLTHNNVFELLMRFSTETGAVEKYEYEDDGDAVTDMVSYRNYGSYLEALSDYYAYIAEECPDLAPVIAGTDIDANGDDIELKYEDFYAQLAVFLSAGLCSAEDEEEVTNRYIDNQADCDYYDSLAVERNRAIVVLNGHANKTQDMVDNITTPGYNTIDAYNELLDEIRELETAIRDLKWFDHNTEDEYQTEKETLILEDSEDIIQAAYEKAWDMYDYYVATPDEYESDPDWEMPFDYDTDISDEI